MLLTMVERLEMLLHKTFDLEERRKKKPFVLWPVEQCGQQAK